ncbi:MAG: hypothetical protein AAF570_10310 [Bacteroidota bacterium]
MRLRFTIGLLFLIPAMLYGQRLTDDYKKKEPTRGLAFGLLAHTYGFGFDVQYHILRDNSTLIVGVAMSSMKHPQELKQESAYADQGGKDYIYDKKNYAYVLSPTFGISKDIIPKSGYNRISVRSTLSGGPTLAFLKPYYLEVAIPFSGNQAYVEVDKYDATKYNYGNIVGEADYFLGMNEITVTPGFTAKLSTMLDFSASKDYIRGVELSLFGSIFSRQLELMDLTDNKQVFIGGSVELLFGNTW